MPDGGGTGLSAAREDKEPASGTGARAANYDRPPEGSEVVIRQGAAVRRLGSRLVGERGGLPPLAGRQGGLSAPACVPGHRQFVRW